MSNLLAYVYTAYRLLNSSLHPSFIAVFLLQRLSFSYQQCNKWFPIALSPYSLTFYQILSKATKMIYLYISTNMTVPVSSTTKSRSPIVCNLKHLILPLQEGLLASPAALLITTSKSYYYTYHTKFCLCVPLSSMSG